MCHIDDESEIALTLTKGLRMIDADKSDPHDRDKRHEVLAPPGRYQAQRIDNPFSAADKPWLVLKGTKIGLAEVYLRTHDGVRIDGSMDQLKVFRAAYARLEMALSDLDDGAIEKLERDTGLKEIDAYARRIHGLASELLRFPVRIAGAQAIIGPLLTAKQAASHGLRQAQQAERKLAGLVKLNEDGRDAIKAELDAVLTRNRGVSLEHWSDRDLDEAENLAVAGKQRMELLRTRLDELETFRKERIIPAMNAYINAGRANDWSEARIEALRRKMERAESLLLEDLARAQQVLEGIARVARAVAALTTDREADCGLDLDAHIRIMDEVRRKNRNGNGDASAA